MAGAAVCGQQLAAAQATATMAGCQKAAQQAEATMGRVMRTKPGRSSQAGAMTGRSTQAKPTLSELGARQARTLHAPCME